MPCKRCSASTKAQWHRKWDQKSRYRLDRTVAPSASSPTVTSRSSNRSKINSWSKSSKRKTFQKKSLLQLRREKKIATGSADSHGVSRAPCYLGYSLMYYIFGYRTITFYSVGLQPLHLIEFIFFCCPTTLRITVVWAVPFSLAATVGIAIAFFTCIVYYLYEWGRFLSRRYVNG